MSGWVALGPITEGGMRCIAMQGGRVVARLAATDEAEALARLGQAGGGPVLRIGAGSPERLPASILPEGQRADEPLAGFVQERPADRISGWVRLQLAGHLARHPRWDGVICTIDGDVRHWLHVSAGEVVSAMSFLTPRLVALLGGAARPDAGALADSLSRPERLALDLRSADVLGDAAARTGHLIGVELAASRMLWLGQRVAVHEQEPSTIAAALGLQGVPCECLDPDDALEAGLGALAAVRGLAGGGA